MVSPQNVQRTLSMLHIGKTVDGHVGIKYTALRCLSDACNEVTLVVNYLKMASQNNGWVSKEELQSWRLRPESASKIQPDYIPSPLRDDYYEACLIRDKSPKAAATLARRCLQGMIRDFCGISKSRLIDEIKELQKRIEDGNAPKGVEPETLEAIDAVRDIGNIGAHMERDINLIVDVDPGEAQALIELIEMLFQEWYVAQHKREQRLANVKLIAAEKKAALEAAKVQKASEEIDPVDAP
jgi:hypothetical protein